MPQALQSRKFNARSYDKKAAATPPVHAEQSLRLQLLLVAQLVREHFVPPIDKTFV
jgi:hypothetical protein